MKPIYQKEKLIKTVDVKTGKKQYTPFLEYQETTYILGIMVKHLHKLEELQPPAKVGF